MVASNAKQLDGNFLFFCKHRYEENAVTDKPFKEIEFRDTKLCFCFKPLLSLSHFSIEIFFYMPLRNYVQWERYHHNIVYQRRYSRCAPPFYSRPDIFIIFISWWLRNIISHETNDSLSCKWSYGAIVHWRNHFNDWNVIKVKED